MIVGYKLTSTGREFFRMIKAAVEDQGEATATLLAILHGRGMFEPVEFTRKEFEQHILGLISGKLPPYEADFDTRDMEEIIRQIAAKMRCTVTLDYERQLARFVTSDPFLNRDRVELPALPDPFMYPPAVFANQHLSVRSIGFDRLKPDMRFSCSYCGDIIPANARRLSEHAQTHALKA